MSKISSKDFIRDMCQSIEFTEYENQVVLDIDDVRELMKIIKIEQRQLFAAKIRSARQGGILKGLSIAKKTCTDINPVFEKIEKQEANYKKKFGNTAASK